MDKKKIHVTREYEKKMSEISPFELKNILIEMRALVKVRTSC